MTDAGAATSMARKSTCDGLRRKQSHGNGIARSAGVEPQACAIDVEARAAPCSIAPSAPVAGPRGREWQHVLQGLRIERLSLRERSDAGIDRREEDPDRGEPGRGEGGGAPACGPLR